MKPIVFYDFDHVYQNEIAIKKDKFEKLLKDVYNAGFEDGKNMTCMMYMPIDVNKLDRDTTYKSNDKIDLTYPKVSSQVISSQL